ncbi:MAG: Rab family GTPase [Candidatus Asgardarchaeia archaeon]
MPLYKVSLIGSSGVGKTSIHTRITKGVFLSTVESTIGVCFDKKCYEVDGKEVTLQIWDFGGQMRYSMIADILIKGSDAVLLVFDVTRPITLEELNNIWIPLALKHKKKDTVMVLVGNKIDLGRRIDLKYVNDIVSKYKIKYYETSAKENKGLNELFSDIAEKLSERPGRESITIKFYKRHVE